MLGGEVGEPVGGRSGHGDRVLREQPKPVLIAVPDRIGVEPERRARDEHLREHD
jgi:hypothetical protein